MRSEPTRRAPSARRAALWIGAALVAAPPALAGGGGEIAQARVALEVRWGAHAGSDELRDDLERALSAKLASACFSSVTIAGTDAANAPDLDLAVVLSDAAEEVRFDDAIATVLEPGAPDKELRRVARCAVNVDAALTARAGGARVGGKHFAVSASRRPSYVGEDPQATARAEAVDSAVRQVIKGLGCGSAKLSRSVADAMHHGADSGAR